MGLAPVPLLPNASASPLKTLGSFQHLVQANPRKAHDFALESREAVQRVLCNSITPPNPAQCVLKVEAKMQESVSSQSDIEMLLMKAVHDDVLVLEELRLPHPTQ